MAQVRFNQQDLRRFVARLNRESDGREQKRDLVAGFKAAAQPAAAAAQAAILSMPSMGEGHQASLRGAVAARVTVDVLLGGRRAGVSVKAHRLRLRGFWHAPRRLNRKAGWRHPVWGRDVTVHQVGQVGWFDVPMRLARPAVQKAAARVVDNIVHRLGD